ncbi:MAG TPA: hypothetical protein VKB66_10080 [Candidatus Acidoferrum sp.]|nr:hypothetical protein [Candidatus Acidoferrum sp.]
MKTFSTEIVKNDPSLRLDKYFRTGVSLHSHTMHSRESLSRLPSYIRRLPIISGIAEREVGRIHLYSGKIVDFGRAYWTPPLSPREAHKLEAQQIESGLGLRPLVSLTDHDNIEAGMHLQMLPETAGTPVSVEWSAPYLETCFHIGVHNFPRESATTWMKKMAKHTGKPDPGLLRKLLHELQGCRSTLVVLNHPFWSAEGVDAREHQVSLMRFLGEYSDVIHALEINGLRSRTENRMVGELAKVYDLPLVSGGDRHGCEPNGTLNVTTAGTFDEFVNEIRMDGYSKIVLMPQYFEPLKLRLFAETWHILGEAPGEFGRRNWTARVFYVTDQGVERPVSFLWGKEGPQFVKQIHWALGLFANPWFRPAMRLTLLNNWEEGL